MADAELLTLQPVFSLPSLQAALALGSPGAAVADLVYTTRAVWCRSVTCPFERCFGSATCELGVCARSPLAAGTPCDDENIVTVNDVCDGSGGCAGVDLCANVTCPPPDGCHLNSTCNGGVCFAGAALADGVPCDDANAGTTNDVCTSGVCIGTPLPTTTTPAPSANPDVCGQGDGPGGCPLPDVCHQPLTCSQGVCFIGPPVVDGTLCDDLNPVTVNDSCTNGVCAGVDPCAGVVCPPTSGQCHVNGTCSNGQCLYTTVPDGQGCDDGDADTVGDGCFAGLCVGTNPCIDGLGQPVVCPPSGDLCTVAGVCFAARENGFWRGVCSNPLAPAGTSCQDTNPDTVNETCTDEGLCLGTDLCANVQCPPISDCHAPGSCAVGVCLPGAPLSNTTRCDDGDVRTVGNTCNGSGQCVGIDLCEQVNCTTAVCHQPTTCFQGICTPQPPLDDFVPCDDNVRAPT